MPTLEWCGGASLLVDVILSINEQTKKLYDDEIALASYSNIKPTLHSLDEIYNALTQVEKSAEQLQGHPAKFLKGVTTALHCYLRLMQGDAIEYVQSVREIQQLPMAMISQDSIAKLSSYLEEQLGMLGFQGDFAQKVTAFLDETRIPRENVIETAHALMHKAREQTIRQILSMPQGEGVDEILPVTGVYWSGFSQYSGDYRGKVTLNVERSWSMPAFTNLITHETYPGHQAVYSHWEKLFRAGKWPLEASYYFTNLPNNGLFEGVPETGLHYLGWDNDTDDVYFTKEQKHLFKIGVDLLDLQRMCQTNACFMVNQLGISKEDAVHYMTKDGIIGTLQANNSYRFFTDPIQKTYYPSYYYGKKLVQKAYDAFPKDKLNQYFDMVYSTPHNTDTFIDQMNSVLEKPFTPFDE